MDISLIWGKSSKNVSHRQQTITIDTNLRGTHEEISEARLKEQALIDAEKGEIKELLTRARAEASASAEKKLSSPRSMKSHNYYARDKLAMKGDWHAWLRQHSHG